jgi:predicted ATPase
MDTIKKRSNVLNTDSQKTSQDNPISQEKSSGNGVFVIVECESTLCTVRQKAIFTKIKATDYTDALLKFKALRRLNRLPQHTMIIPEAFVNYYPKGV